MWPKRFNRQTFPASYLLASCLLLVLVLWLAFGDMQHFQSEAPAERQRTATPPQVEINEQPQQLFIHQHKVQGQLKAANNLTLRAKVAGFVVEMPVAQGDWVARGDTLLTLDNDALPERLEQARANVAVAQAELTGAETLRRRELISEPEYLRLQAELSRSVAEVAELSRRLEDTRPNAPFSGRLDKLDIELGELLQPGKAWGRLIDDRVLTGSAWVAQQHISQLNEGLPVMARLLDGSTLEGELSHIASQAESATRSFYIEVTLDNPERLRLAGGSAEFIITLPAQKTHAISPALLTLNDQGQLAVKHLDGEGIVQQTTIKLVSADTQSAHVTGLPDPVRLIVQGSGFVDVGQHVVAQESP